MIDVSPQYLAGVIDSDGSISITKRHKDRVNPNYSAMIQIGWVYKPETELFMQSLVNKYGGSFKVIKPGKSSMSKRDHIKYCAYGKTVDKILKDVKPFLILKKKQTDNVLNLRNIVNTYIGKVRPEEKGKKLEELYKYNLSLNDKNGY